MFSSRAELNWQLVSYHVTYHMHKRMLKHDSYEACQLSGADSVEYVCEKGYNSVYVRV